MTLITRIWLCPSVYVEKKSHRLFDLCFYRRYMTLLLMERCLQSDSIITSAPVITPELSTSNMKWFYTDYIWITATTETAGEWEKMTQEWVFMTFPMEFRSCYNQPPSLCRKKCCLANFLTLSKGITLIKHSVWFAPISHFCSTDKLKKNRRFLFSKFLIHLIF